MMVGGNIALVPDEDSLRSFMGGLPAFFMGEVSRIIYIILSADVLTFHVSRA